MLKKDIYYFNQESYDKGAISFNNTRQYFWSDLSFIKKYFTFKIKILDFGCGNGRLLNLIDVFNPQYLGVDVSLELLKLAKKEYKNYRFSKIDPLFQKKYSWAKNNTFSLIISIGVFHHFPKGRIRQAIYNRLIKLLRKDGIFIITVWNLKASKFKKYLPNKKQGLSYFKEKDGKISFKRYLYNWDLEELKVFLLKNKQIKILKQGFTKRNNIKTNLYFILQKI